jgi:MFS family permease
MTAFIHDVRDERKTLLLLSLGFGLVGFDRWLMAPMFPYMMGDLHLNYAQLGSLIGILSVAWGLWSIVTGPVSDRFGRKRILVATMIAFSLLSSLSGLVASFASLMAMRAVMGIAEGTFTPASLAANSDASSPARRGLNQGLQLSTMPLFGMGIAPVVATQLMRMVPSWHWVFAISAVPGLILSALIWAMLREQRPVVPLAAESHAAKPKWSHLFKSRNVIVATIAMICAMGGIFVITAMMPTYLVDVLHLDARSMGFVASAVGFGGFIGCFALPGISDYVGRRPTALTGFFAAALLLYFFSYAGANPVVLFALLFCIAVFAIGLLSLLSGPVTIDAAPVGLVASAIGLVSGVGETVGGGIAPAVAGFVAQHFGLARVLDFALCSLVIGGCAAVFLLETAPRRRAVLTPGQTTV